WSLLSAILEDFSHLWRRQKHSSPIICTYACCLDIHAGPVGGDGRAEGQAAARLRGEEDL
ncbi:MAG: hypothetical protein ACK559_28725, partial [bacterium]